MTGVIATIPRFQFSSSTGAPLANGTLTVYVAGSTTPTNTWQDQAQTTLNTNPVQLDSRGECVLWLDSAVNYKFVLKNSGGAIQWTQDNISGSISASALAASSGASLVGYLPAGTGAVATDVQSKLRESVSVLDFGAVGDGVADDTAALQAALDYQSNATTTTTDAAGNTIGTGPELHFPDGRYVVSATLNIGSAYAFISGEKAVLEKAAVFTGTNALQKAGSAWRININGIQFKDFENAVYLDSSNLNSGKVEFENCGFFNITNHAIWIDCQSSIVAFKDCIWRSCKHEIYIETGDAVIVDGGWIQRGLLTDDYDGGIVVGTVAGAASLLMRGTLLVPRSQTVVEPCWVKNYGKASFENVRVGGETGQHTLVNNFAIGTDVSADPKNGVNVDGCDVYAGTDCVIRLFDIPHSILLTNNRGFTGAGLSSVKWSSTISAPDQATKIAAQSTSANRHIIFQSGNTLDTFPAANLIPLTNMQSQMLQRSTAGNLAIIQEFRSAAITASQVYGRWDHIGYDATAGASGVRAQIRVVATDTAGATETVIANAPANGALVDVAKSISTGFVSAVDNARTLGNASFRWSTVFAGTGAINTSDERQKQQVRTLTDAERAVAVRCKSLIRAFKFNEAVDKKADAARIHFGVIAQEVKAAFEAEGLVAEQYAIVCYDEWPAVLGEDGNEISPAGDRYGVRYEELLAFIISAL